MKIAIGRYVIFEYEMYLDTGEHIGGTESGKPIGFIVGDDHMLPFVEHRLLGMQAGEKGTFWLLPNEAFGERDPAKERVRSRDSFPPHVQLEEGATYQTGSDHGQVPFTITSIGPDSVTIDLNHPLAGKSIRIDVHIHEVRELTPEEQQVLSRSKRHTGDPYVPPGMTGGAVKV
ncbi:MAG: peptidylprolyl isomerase [Myxococcota bacterium]|nr:peptidylprolyl isomerase [Myxococcota bacterium]